MAKTLDELKEELYEAFNAAKENAIYPNKHWAQNYPEQSKAAAASLQAAAELARSIVAVEHEIADRDERRTGMKLPGK